MRHLAIASFGVLSAISWSASAEPLPRPSPPAPVPDRPWGVPSGPGWWSGGHGPWPPLTLSLRTRKRVVLYRRVYGEADEWRPACDSPCDGPLVAGTYRIDGDGVPTSETFTLAAGHHTLDVDAGSQPSRITGIVVTGVAGAMMLYGSLFLMVNGGVDGPVTTRDPNLDKVGAVLLVSGAAALMVGIGMMLSNRTTVTIDGSAPRETTVTLPGGISLAHGGVAF